MSKFELMQDAPPAGAPPSDASSADAPKDGSADAAAPAEKKQGGKTPMIFYAWGAMSTWLLVDGYLTYNAYDTLATNLVTNKLSGTSWTTSTVKSTQPISYWIYSSYVAMGLESISVLGWLMGVMGKKKAFFKIAKMAMLFPLIEAAMWSFTYFSYTACSSATSTQFDGSTTGVTQITSCSGSTASAVAAYFSTTGTWAPYVYSDNYSTWFMTNVGSDVGMIGLNMIAQKKFKQVMAAKKKQAADDSAAPADPSAAPADPSAAPADPAAAPADPSTPAAPPANDSKPAPADNNNGGFGDGSNWSEPTPAPAPAPEPEPEPKKCGYWGCL